MVRCALAKYIRVNAGRTAAAPAGLLNRCFLMNEQVCGQQEAPLHTSRNPQAALKCGEMWKMAQNSHKV